MKLIYLEWEDAISQASWCTKDELDDFSSEVALIRQVGWIYKETKKYLILVGRLDDRNEGEEKNGYGMLQKIPKTWIRKRKEIKL